MSTTVDMRQDLELRGFGSKTTFRACVTFPKRAHQCRVALCSEDEGGFSAYALNLPGVASQGETEEEALANLKEAYQETLKAYAELEMDVPWGPVTPDLPVESEFGILVNG